MKPVHRFLLATTVIFITLSNLTTTTNSNAMTIANTTTIDPEINQVLENYTQGWTKGDLNLLKSLWDFSRPNISYMAVESTEILRGADAIRNYYDRNVGAVAVTIQIKQPVVDKMGKYAQVTCFSEITVVDKAGTKTVYRPRLVITMVRKSNKWFLIHYVEAGTIE
jgi:hypothetical protein